MKMIWSGLTDFSHVFHMMFCTHQQLVAGTCQYGVGLFLSFPFLSLTFLCVEETAFEAGVRVQIHSQAEPPFVHELGFGVAPGFQTFVATQEQRVSDASSPVFWLTHSSAHHLSGLIGCPCCKVFSWLFWVVSVLSYYTWSSCFSWIE